MDSEKIRKVMLVAVPIAIPFYIGNKLGEVWRLMPTNLKLTAKLSEFLLRSGSAFNNPMPSFNPQDLLVGACVSAAFYAYWTYRRKNAKKYRKGKEYGNAMWGTHEDIKPYMDEKNFSNNVLLTQTERLTMGKPSAPKYARNKNILVIGGSGSGKTRFFVKPNLMQLMESIGAKARVLDGAERLQQLYGTLNPFTKDRFIFDWYYAKKNGISTKDFIAPTSINIGKTDFEVNARYYGSVFSLTLLSGELSDEVLSDFLKDDNLVAFNMHISPIDQIATLKFVRRKLSDMKGMKVDAQKKAATEGFDSDLMSEGLKAHIEGAEKVLNDLSSKNERLFKVTSLIRTYAKNKKALMLQEEQLKRIAQKNNCKLMNLDYRQEQALASTLPLGYNAVSLSRKLTTSSIAVFVPFTTLELFQGGKATYYGLNALSRNLIMSSRLNLKNPNGLVLGTPGAGKSMSAKREMVDVFLKSADDILICDPEGEYYPLIRLLDGQVVTISSSSHVYINPMEIYLNTDTDENPIAVKSEFLISFMELVAGGALLPEEITIIDSCVKDIYTRWIDNGAAFEEMPILEDFWNALNEMEAYRLANSLELYVHGTQNIFNHRSNVDINSRVVCFDIKELGNQLRKLAMLIIQDTVWNRVSLNRNKKATRYYIDEFHLLLKEPQTAKYSVEMWKRFRKWGGVPTGITQNVKDLLSSQEIENIFDNSDFVYMLNQSAGDRAILQEKLHISDEQLKYVTNVGPGQGLIFYGDVILPFKDEFPRDTKLYSLMTTNPNEIKKQ